MIIKCDFCKTEYNIKRLKTSKVECPICGNIWNVGIKQRYNLSIIILSLCALLSALIFSLIITKYKYEKSKTLTISILNIEPYKDNDVNKFKINYTIKNQTKYIYGVPNFDIILINKNNKIISKDRVLSPIPTIESSAIYKGSYVISKSLKDIKKINIEFATQ